MRSLAAAVVAAALVAAAAASGASAALTTGFDDNKSYLTADAQARASAFDTTTDTGAGVVRLDLVWSQVVTGQPADPSDPADPAYDFSAYDAAIRDAAARRLRVLITFYSVPEFAEGSDRPANWKYESSWKPDPVALGGFARAVATRYSGGYQGLPAVHYFEAWNEPNLDLFLSPQYEGGKLVAPDLYRRMVNAVAASVHGVNPANQVLVGSTAPYGEDPGGERTRPLAFLRDLLCLDRGLRATPCPEKTELDVLSHHPINLSGPPTQSAINRDDASSSDLEHVVGVLRAAERTGSIASAERRHPVWVTEFWWQIGKGSATPNARVQGQWVEQSLYLFWKAGAKVAINFELRDEPAPAGGFALNTGVLTADGRRKPSYTAMRFPFVVDARSAASSLAWGRTPVSGSLTVEARKSGRWVAIKRVRVRAGQLFHPRLSQPAKGKFRARVKGETSLVWDAKPALQGSRVGLTRR